MGLLRLQLAGLLAARGRAAGGTSRARLNPAVEHGRSRCGGSARGWRRPRAAPPASWHSPAPPAHAVVRGGRAAGYVARHGVLGTAAAGGRAAAGDGRSAHGRARRPVACWRRRRANGEGRHCGLVAPHPPHERRRGQAATSSPGAARTDSRTVHGPRRQPRARSGRPVRARRAQATVPAASRRDGQPRPPQPPVAGSPTRPGTNAKRVARRHSPGPRQLDKPAPPSRGATPRRSQRKPTGPEQAMTPTLRRLNDRERYYGLSLAAAG